MNRNLGFIGGGQMAEALISGLIKAKKCTPVQINISEPNEKRRQFLDQTYQVKASDNLTKVVESSGIIILAVKPQVMEKVLIDLKPIIGNQLIISIAAGIQLSFYESILENDSIPIIRVMPNTPALIQEGATALCKNSNVSESDLDYALSLFNTIGITVAVEEKAMDAITGLSGSGPAYVFSFIEALIDGGVKSGLSRDVARDLTIQTVLGATQMVSKTKQHPAVLRDMVTSPAGTTASGLHVLQDSGFNGILISSVEAACNRSIELGKD